ncbi:MAG: MFS transporter [Gemmataceae bacterium]|nr:MFS transporter [Gemmataceae bacterium]MDW8264729.1 MFS transporter [Gemmataceae bacterium]
MNQSNPSPLSAKPRPSRARFVFLAYAAALSLILYLDRNCIAQAADSIAHELELNKVALGWVFSAFTFGYTLFEIPSGAWGDRYGPKRVLCRIVVCWSVFTILTGCIWNFSCDTGLRWRWQSVGLEVPLVFDGFLLLLLLRFFFGVGEAGAYPNLAKCTSRWFPATERGLAQGVVATAGRVGSGLAFGATLAIASVTDAYLWPGAGWRVAFYVFGLLGIGWALLFHRWFRDTPADHPDVNEAELAWIAGGIPHGCRLSPTPPPTTPWPALLASGNLWAYSAMACGSTFVFYFYMSFFATYLSERHALPPAWGWVAGLPLIVGSLGCALGGFWTDWLVRRTGSRRWGRRLAGLAGKGGGAICLLLAAGCRHTEWVVLWIALAAFASDTALAAQWAVATDTGGRFVGTVFGFMNTFAGLGGALSPVLVGFLLEQRSPTVDGRFNLLARQQAWDLVLGIFAAGLAFAALCWLRIDADEPMASTAAS